MQGVGSWSARARPWKRARMGVLAAAPHYTAAHHTMRILIGGLPGGARWRPHADRGQRCCRACEAGAEWAWTPPHGDDNGMAWCSACAGPWHGREGWALMPDGLRPEGLRDIAADIRHSRVACPDPRLGPWCSWCMPPYAVGVRQGQSTCWHGAPRQPWPGGNGSDGRARQ